MQFLAYLDVERFLLPDLVPDGGGDGEGEAEEHADLEDLNRVDAAQEAERKIFLQESGFNT